MIRKGKLLRNTAIVLAIISVFGSSLSSVNGMELSKSNIGISQYIDGEYDLDVTLRHDTKDEDSMANGYLEKTKLVVSNNKMYIKMIFNNGSMIKEANPTVNNESKTVENILNSDGTRTVKFEINSQDDVIKLGVVINPFGEFKVNADCIVRINQKTSLPTTGDKNDAVTSPTPNIPESGDDTDKDENITGQVLNTILKHESKDQNSSANNYLKSTKLVTENNKKYMVMVFDNTEGLLVELIGKVNDKEVKTSNEFDDTSKTLTIKFEINSLEDDLKLSFTYNNPIFGKHTVIARIQSELESSGDTTTPPTTDDTNSGSESTGGNDTGNGSNSTTGNDSGSTGGSNTYKNGYYQLKNTLHLDNPTGYAMVRNLLSETTNMEVKNGKTYITLRMSMASQMSNINIKVDGKNANFTKTNIGNDTLEFKIEVPSTSSKLTFSMFVAAMGQNVDFKVSFNESTIKFISSNEEPTIPSTGTATGGSTTGGSTSTDTDSKVESSAVKGKLYTIQNQIISSSSTGQQMARKYTSSTTKIEEIDGKMYATLTFTGVDLMSNHKIYVNGSVVSHSITSKTSSSVSLRFAIPNVNADIKVQAYIIPMGSTVTYGVKLLESTLKFVKDFEIANGTLPQTGSLINSEAVMATGGLLAMSGVLLRRKRK